MYTSSTFGEVLGQGIVFLIIFGLIAQWITPSKPSNNVVEEDGCEEDPCIRAINPNEAEEIDI